MYSCSTSLPTLGPLRPCSSQPVPSSVHLYVSGIHEVYRLCPAVGSCHPNFGDPLMPYVPSHCSQVRRRCSALPHMSRPYSTIVAVLPPPRHTLQRLWPLIYHHLDIRSDSLTCPWYSPTSPLFSPTSPRYSPQSPSFSPLRDISLRAPHSVQHPRCKYELF